MQGCLPAGTCALHAPRQIRTDSPSSMWCWGARKQPCKLQSLQKRVFTLCAAAELAEEAPTAAGSAAQETQLAWRMAASVIPHPEKAQYGGEDAFFISSVGGGALGVADGVGGWAYAGINPAEYARTFMHLACAYLEGKSVHPVQPEDLRDSSSEAAADTDHLPADASMDDDGPLPIASTSDSVTALSSRGALAAAHAGTILPGSATACVMRLNRDTCALSAANVGDSGFMVVRQGQTIFRSEPQEHFFDCPYQFAASPEFAPNTDHVDSAAVVEVELQAGDIIVAGTDGLWDNLPEEEVLTLLPSTSDQVHEAAQRMAEAASAHANDDTYESPYTQEALKRGFDIPWWQKVLGTRFTNGSLQLASLRGGKLDDITVVLAMVDEELKPEEPLPQQSSPDDVASSDTDSAASSTEQNASEETQSSAASSTSESQPPSSASPSAESNGKPSTDAA